MTKFSKVPFSVSSSGATAATRYVGGTVTGSPTAGIFVVGDFAVAQNGHIFVCTAGGTPGTWVDAGTYGGGGGSTVVSVTTAYTAANGNIVLANGTFSVTLPAAAVGVQITVKNTGTGVITIVGTVDASTTTTLSPLQSITVVSDGTAYYDI